MRRTYCFIFLFALLAACQPAPPASSPLSNPDPSIIENESFANDLEDGKEDVSITLSFAGDTMMAGRVATIVEEKGVDYPFASAAPIFRSSDIAMLNLETAISHRQEPSSEKQYAFRSDPSMANALKRAGIDLVTIANNHALDYGPEAFLDTIDYLKKAGVHYVGGGANQTEAYAPKTFEIKGKTFRFFAFSRVFPEANWHAGHDHPGMASAYDPEFVFQFVESFIGNDEYTIVYFHWGEELADDPLPYQIELARGLIDRGVDLVVGSHPHVLQGLEWYKGKLIAYSLGNFVFTTSHYEQARLTAILQATFHENEIIPRVIPMYIDQGAVWLADEERHEEIMNRLRRLSSGGAWKNDVFHSIP